MRRGHAVGEGRPVETPSASPPDLEACFRHLPHVVVLLGPAGEVLAANAAAQRLAREVLSRPLEVGRRLADQLPAEARRGFEDALAELRSGGDGVLGERPIEYAGRTAWFDIRLARMHGEGEKTDGTILTLVSADDRRQAHEALAHSERRFRLLLQHAADGVTVIGPDGSVLYISPAVERIFGRSPEEMVGTDGFSYIHPEDLPVAVELFRSSLEDPGRTHRAAFRMSRKDGTWPTWSW